MQEKEICTYNTLGIHIGGVLMIDPVCMVSLRFASCKIRRLDATYMS